MEETYQANKIEQLVQSHWDNKKTFSVKENTQQEKYYCLSMLPYPSGNLHMGHVRNYTIGDVISRYQRLLGKNVLQPIGWDAFGLPAERAAILNNTPPSIWTYSNIYRMKKQLKSLGFAYDWDRELITCQPEYYRWEQWFFNILYQKGLTYKKKSLVNWCPQDHTVLANEQVINNCCWRCNTKIQKKNISQWFLKITKYADELLYNLDALQEWPQQIKIMQKNWIGRSTGLEISFKIFKNATETITVYTTRPDTLMGVTYIAIAIEHPLSKQIRKNNRFLSHFFDKCKNFNNQIHDSSTQIEAIETNIYAIHPLNHDKLPIWISNHVHLEYGTGATMGVPAHNQDDWKFAHQYNLPIKPVIYDINHKIPIINNQAMVYKGILFNSGEFDGLSHQIACKTISRKLIEKGIAKYKVCYRMQDWSVSRQRYWGVPIPIITLQNGNIIPIPPDQLPVILPENIFTDNTTNPLKNNNWIYTTYNNTPALRESDTFDTFMESSWYYARFTCPNYKNGMLSPKAVNYWLPIDQYIGGIEHATMHLIYFRFYHKLMRDFGLVNSDEPAKRLLCQGMVLADAFYYFNDKNERIWVSPKNVTIKHDKKGNIVQALDQYGNYLTHFGMVKMSKSKKNGINPDIFIKKYGADTVRLFIMFAAPVNMPLEWKETNIIGIYRFLKKLWRLVYEHIKNGPTEVLNIKILNDDQKLLRKKIYKTILKVSDDIDRRQMFNTAIASIMQLTNSVISMPKKNKQDRALLNEALTAIICMLYPFTPHIAFVLWRALGEKHDIDEASWPIVDKSALTECTKTLIIQINGKLRHKITILNNTKKNKILHLVLQESTVIKHLKNKKIIRTIYIENKLINLITKE